MRELIGGRVELEQLRAFNIADLLGRDTVQTDLSAIAGLVSGQVVLVTGAGGRRPENPPPELTAAEQDAVRELVRQARASGTALTGPGGLLKQLTKMVVEAALDEEMSEHLGMTRATKRAATGATPGTGNGPRR